MFAYPLLFPGLLILLFANLASAASLSDFTPRVIGLTGTCLWVYRRPIPGCLSQDFQTAGSCSARCISGLVDLATLVKADCSDADVDNNSIIAIFLNGQGPPTLCSNAASASARASPNTAAPTTTAIIVRSSTLDLTTTPTAETSIQVDTSLPPTATLSAVIPPSEPTTAATARTTAGANEPAPSAPAPSAPASTDTSTSNGNGNGGGDPFNLFNASPPSAVLSTWLLTCSLAVCALLAHIPS